MSAFLTTLLIIWGLAWLGSVALYFTGGWLLLQVAARRPEARIQPRRDGMKRARAEIIESLRSLAITAFCLALAITLTLSGLTLWSPIQGWWGLLVGLAILIFGYDLYFYWAHRLLHTRWFIRFHRWHHKSMAPTVWSADSQSPVETFMIQSFMIWAAILFPVSPLALVLHRLYDHVNGQLGHSGHEFFAGQGTRFPSPMVCTSYHDQHHEHYDWNYGNYFSLWDRLHGTLHPDYDRTVEARAAKPAPAE